MPIFHRKSTASSSHGTDNHTSALHALFSPHTSSSSPPSPHSYASNRASRSSSSSGRSGQSHSHSHNHRKHHHHSSRHRSNSIFHRHGEEEDPSISAARKQVTRAEAMEKEASKALMATRQAVHDAREHVRRLDREASEEARLARIKQHQVRSISKRAKPLGRSL
ncbi:hypothetical protein P168DRAFT_281731 [Aspergillus campestris IBT 28561]|uniref:Uncharacterized protein n=1 Tax=Aspergillus campestris (strain IBT 28561) TaxID=1392248 RepID=A0A2I1D2H2_ASPC2|nr:uncharacterized protein P168DRAFT_281731 [Aspergillus campestris IBT 28561]PKY04080.1 hypothetical protein P168DRAFT_281731 [Aspergillus campestris IBT 28561]